MKTKTLDVVSLVRKNILRMKPYSSARDEFKGEAEVFLDANENPYPSPFNRYPDPLQWEVKEKLSSIKGVRPEQIFLGNGSDEAIDLLIRAFCEPKQDKILQFEPTYGMYAVCANVNDVEVKSLLLDDNFDITVPDDATLDDPSVKLIFICSPNNPSGNLISENKIALVAERFRGLVVVDEAYIDFTTSKSWVSQLDRYPNLVVLQTFSKAWGLAGLRLGMAFSSAAIISILNKIKYPYNVNIQTQEIALNTLRSNEKDARVKEIIAEREKMASALRSVALTQKVYPSDANFLLVKVVRAHDVYEELMKIGIIVRDRSNVKLCDDCLRITIGTPQENARLMEALLALRLN